MNPFKYIWNKLTVDNTRKYSYTKFGGLWYNRWQMPKWWVLYVMLFIGFSALAFCLINIFFVIINS